MRWRWCPTSRAASWCHSGCRRKRGLPDPHSSWAPSTASSCGIPRPSKPLPRRQCPMRSCWRTRSSPDHFITRSAHGLSRQPGHVRHAAAAAARLRDGPARGPVRAPGRAARLSGHRLVLLPLVPRDGHGAQRTRRARARVTLPYASGYHAPVMAREVMDLLRPERGGTYLDGTLGGGGHAEALLERGATARLIGVDRDPDALAEAA